MTKRILAVMVLVSTLTLVQPAPAAAHWNCAYPILPFVGAVIALPGQILGSLVYGPAGYGPAAYGPAPYAPPVYYAPPPVYGPYTIRPRLPRLSRPGILRNADGRAWLPPLVNGRGRSIGRF